MQMESFNEKEGYKIMEDAPDATDDQTRVDYSLRL